jgi:hypothetical protein
MKPKLYLEGILSLPYAKQQQVIDDLPPEQAEEVRKAIAGKPILSVMDGQLEVLKAKILAYLIKHNETAPLRRLRQDLNFGRYGTNAELALSNLIVEKRVLVIGAGTKSDPKMVGILKNSLDKQNDL